MPSPVRALVAALVALSVASAQDTRAPEAYQLAIGLQQRGLHEEAVRRFEEFLQANPRHALAAEGHYRLAQSLVELQQAPAAMRALVAALQVGGAQFRLQAEARYRLAELQLQAGQHEAAAASFEQLAKQCGDDHYLLAAAWYGAGEAQRELQHDERAAAAFAAAAAAATGARASYRFAATYQLGFAQLRLTLRAEAAATFAAAAAAAPDDAAKGECLFLSGDALLRHGAFDDAAQALRAAAKLPGEFADDAMHALAWVHLGRGEQEAAREAFAAALRQFPSSPLAAAAHLERGRSFYRDGQHAEAEHELEPLLAAGTAVELLRQAQELLGLCALARGAGEQALAPLQQALAAAAPADRPRLHYALGEALSNLQRWPDALAAYRQVPAEVDDTLRGEALYGACFALHALGQHAASIVEAKRVLAITPRHRLADQAALAVAENEFAQQHYEAAEKAFAAVAEVEQLRAGVAWKLAWCRYLRGDKQDAAKRFATIADGRTAEAEEALSMLALAALEAGRGDDALAAADRYRARFADGRFLDRCERVAARVLRQRGDLAAAQKRLQRAAAAASRREGDAAAVADRSEEAELAFQQGDFRGAAGLFAALADRDDTIGARALAGQAFCAFELGDDDACARSLQRAKLHPAAAGELPGLLELESALAHRRQDWPAAIAAAQQFLERCADHAKAPALRYALGIAEARHGDHAAARTTLAALAQSGLYARPDRVLYELAWACRRGGDEPAALAAFAQLAASADADGELVSEAKLHLGLQALASQDLAAAGPLLEAVQGAHRGKALYRLGFAEFEAAAGDPVVLARARDRFGAVAALADEPLAPEALFCGAECCHRLGDERAAVDKLRTLLQLAPAHARAARARLLLGECAVSSEQGDVAVPALEQFLRGEGLEPGDVARANFWLGRARQQRQEHAAAEACFVKVTELSDGPLAAEAQFRIGESRERRGDVLGAADAYVKLPILYAHAEWVRRGLLHAGLAYEQLRQPDKAARFFRELVEQHAGSEEAKVAARHQPR